jgi:hypothetical protein
MEPFLFAGALLFNNKKIAARAVFRTVWETPNRPSFEQKLYGTRMFWRPVRGKKRAA